MKRLGIAGVILVGAILIAGGAKGEVVSVERFMIVMGLTCIAMMVIYWPSSEGPMPRSQARKKSPWHL